MNSRRRLLLRGAVGASVTAALLSGGLLTPVRVLAAWPKAAFAADEVDDVLAMLSDGEERSTSDAIKIKVPEPVAENGARVPVTVSTTLPGVESISLIVEDNPSPLSASFHFGERTQAYVSTYLKMAKDSHITVLVKADGRLYTARKAVRVAEGGCGG